LNITSKSRYALKIMMDLALHQENLSHRVDIAQRQGVPLDYMDQILLRLKDHRLIDSTRGRSGGYRLGRVPSQISVYDIFNAVEDGFIPVLCLDGFHSCQAEQFCQSKDAWGTISESIRETLSKILLSSIISDRSSLNGESLNMKIPGESNPYAIDQEGNSPPQEARVHECRAPRRSSTSTNSNGLTNDLQQAKRLKNA